MNTSIPMVATARQTYEGRALKSGDEFEAISEAQAADLVAVNMARRAKPVPRLLDKQAPIAQYATKPMEAAVSAAVADADEAPAAVDESKAKAPTYNRRDLHAGKRR